MDDNIQIIQGDALSVLKTLESESVQCCVTSPPYWSLRDYGMAGQIGNEPTPQEFVDALLDVFLEVRRVMKADATLWVNLGDSYFSSQNSNRNGVTGTMGGSVRGGGEYKTQKRSKGNWTLKSKDLCGMPWRVAFALQDAGFWLRQDIVWAKSNPMPESVTDRCTKSHEYIFLLSKSADYFYNHEAIKQPVAESTIGRGLVAFGGAKAVNGQSNGGDPRNGHRTDENSQWGKTFDYAASCANGANRRSVWNVPVAVTPEAHFATFPEKLIEPCILAGSREGDLVLDPFNGAGTTGLVSIKHKRRYLGIELNPEYIEISKRRLASVQVRLFG